MYVYVNTYTPSTCILDLVYGMYSLSLILSLSLCTGAYMHIYIYTYKYIYIYRYDSHVYLNTYNNNHSMFNLTMVIMSSHLSC